MTMTSYLHVLDGRIRIKLPSIKQAPRKALQLEQTLRNLDGVTSVKANPLTGNVLILFDTRTMSQEQIFAALKQHRYLQSDQPLSPVYSPATSPCSTATSTFGDRLIQLVVETAVEMAVKRIVIGLF